MKNLSIFTLLLSSIISMVYVSCNNLLPIVGNGNLVTSERTVSTFEKISSGGSNEISFHVSPEYRVVVTADSNLVEFVTTDVRNNVLNIGFKRGSYSSTRIQIDVYCPALTSVSISGSGSFTGNDTIITSTFDSNVSGSGKIIITGSGKNSDINISGSGIFSGSNFTINNAAVHVRGSGKAIIFVSEYLNVVISGSGEVDYRGDPKIESKTSGSGQINKL